MRYPLKWLASGISLLVPAAAEESKPAGAENRKEDDTRPLAHRTLCEAAEFAVAKRNTDLIQSLLKAGLSINLPLDPQTGWTALHYCAVHNVPTVAKVLVKNGADLDIRSRYDERAIDMAFEGQAFELCEVLKRPEGKEDNIEGYPRGLLDELFRERKNDRPEELRFLSINGQDPSPAVLDYFRKRWPNVRVRSAVEEVDRKADEKAPTSYRDRETKGFGIVVELRLKKEADSSFRWSYRRASGPALSGGGSSGKIAKKYGYWLSYEESSWDE